MQVSSEPGSDICSSSSHTPAEIQRKRRRMSLKVDYSPLPHVQTPPFNKVCDVGLGMKGQTLPGSPEPVHDCLQALKARVWTEPAEKGLAGMERLLKKCRTKKQLVRECMAECLGVYILIVFGCGSVAQVTTSDDKKGQYLSINLGFALGVTFGVFVSRGVSGAHLNPAISLCLCLLGRFPWMKLPFFIFFQVLGAFLAAATVFVQYYDAIYNFGKGKLTVTGNYSTAGIFSTYPADYLSQWGGIMDQLIGTAALMTCVLALGDRRNTHIPVSLQPPLLGGLVLVLGIAMGSNSGYALNPARDFGPRLFTAIAGWGPAVFMAGNSWWWVPIVVPCLGTVLGALIYELMIEIHHPAPPADLVSSSEEAAEDKTGVELEGVQPDCEKPTLASN